MAQAKAALAESENLPELVAGYNFQGIPGSNYHGLYAGLSIPLWSASKIKAHNVAVQQQLKVEMERERLELEKQKSIQFKAFQQKTQAYVELKEFSKSVLDLEEKPVDGESRALERDIQLRLLEMERDILDLYFELSF